MTDPIETLLHAAQLRANLLAKDDLTVINARTTRDIRPEVLDGDGRMRILPASWWKTTTVQERGMFGARTGIYSFPTVELIDYLRAVIGDRPAIEIGAGHGVVADALGIPGTDSRMLEWPKYATMYRLNGATVAKYGPNVVDMHASRAVRRYRPDVVIGCWVTHKYDPARHEAGGNEVGIDEEDILRHCKTYVMVGHETAHAGKKIWSRKHEIIYPDWVYSRSMKPEREFIAVWPGSKK